MTDPLEIPYVLLKIGIKLFGHLDTNQKKRVGKSIKLQQHDRRDDNLI